MTDFPVIDSHIHVQPWKMIRPECLHLMQNRRADRERIDRMMYDPDEFVRYLDEQRIEKAIAINYVSDVMGFTFEANRYAADFVRRSHGRVLSFGSLDPIRSADPAAEMDEIIQSGLVGIKLHPSHQMCFPNAYRQGNRIVEIMYRKAEQAGLVLMVHTGTSIFPGARNLYADPIYCDDIGVDFPKLKIILAHAGRPLWMETAVFLARRFANVMLDISSIPPQGVLKFLPRLEELADKVLWGTDWPAPGVPSMRENVDRFLSLPISDSAKRKILHDNAKRWYDL